jgi:hemoglobin-like flavoprotein
MDRTHEILETICSDRNHPNGISSWALDHRKLAAYLAELEEKMYQIADEAAGNEPY